MTLEYIRRAYGVPAHRGGRVRYTGDSFSQPYHPTWEIEFLDKDHPHAD